MRIRKECSMKTYYECVACLLRQTVEAASMMTESQDIQEKVLRRVLTEMAVMDLNKTPPHMARLIHQYVREALDIADPYQALKHDFNQLALEMAEEMRKTIQQSDDPFQTAAKISIAGNIIDFGVRNNITHDEVRETVAECLNQALQGNTAEELSNAIEQSTQILFLGDNAGEIVFDRLLLEQMPLDHVTYVVKGKPIINDATMEDAIEAGLPELVNVIDNGSDAPGTILDLCSPDFQERFTQADLIIAKGQANYETLSDEKDKNIYFLLKVKCPVIARDLRCDTGELVLKHI
ncbi:MAG: ARMT1-like domain-containing protein [Bacillota bacterium]|nr:ARMT1-like domain-containing protein [Bacillota bacterium]